MTTVTALDICQDAAEAGQWQAPGNPLSNADAARMLSILNDMIDGWSNQSLACFAWLQQSFAMVVNQSIYTVGPGGHINGTRPLRISDAAGSAYLLDPNNNKYPMDVVDQLTFNLRTTAAVNSNIPDTLFYDPQFPLGNINTWPTPNDSSYTCYFYSYLQLSDLSSLSTVVQLPPGYVRALKRNLTVEAWPYFKEGEVNPAFAQRAKEALADVKRNNMRTQQAVFDPEIVARGQSTYNIRSDRNY